MNIDTLFTDEEIENLVSARTEVAFSRAAEKWVSKVLELDAEEPPIGQQQSTLRTFKFNPEDFPEEEISNEDKELEEEAKKTAAKEADDKNFKKPRAYECDFCDKIHFHPRIARKHYIFHVTNSFRCTRCGRFFKNRIYLKRHIWEIHVNKSRKSANPGIMDASLDA